MSVDSQAQKDVLLRSDEEYRQLAQKHQEMESRLTELSAKPYLTSDEQFEEVTLKKRKLQIKDHMADILRRSRTASSSMSHAASAPPQG